LVPTFRNPSNGQIVHQLDHLFVSAKLATHLTSCKTGERDRVFGESLSDHLPIIADFALPADAG
jgi:endonuclease/exonuclease/phosphatase family metal-dependent hydrolase